MSIDHDRQQAAQAAYTFSTKAAQTGRPTKSGSPMYAFYDDANGTYHYFMQGDHHVVYAKRSNPENATAFVRSYGGPIALGGYIQDLNILSPHEAFRMFRETILRPANYSYVAIFDMSKPTWMIPVSEWPSGAQVSR